MASILELFNQKTVLDYTRNREYPTFLGEELFPEIKSDSLEFEQIKAGSKVPVIASVHAFDTEAEIGSREAEKNAFELALIKRKIGLTEKEIIALENPRNAAEQQYLMQRVFNDLDVLVQGVRARVELMRMEVLATGLLTLDENGLKATYDYGVPETHQDSVGLWQDDANPLEDLERWCDTLDTAPTRALTSQKIKRALMHHPKIISAVYGNSSGRLLSVADFDAFMQSHGFPVIRSYDQKYKKQLADGSYTTGRYFPEDRIVLFNDDELGQTVYGPTAEEIRLTRDPSVETGMVGKVFTTVLEENTDPVSTWKKAVATALPSFPAADEVFQAQITLPGRVATKKGK